MADVESLAVWLEDLRLASYFATDGELEAAVSQGIASSTYRLFVSNAMHMISNCLDKSLPEIPETAETAMEFFLDLNEALRHLECPYAFTEESLQTPADACTLLDYLCGEVAASRILAARGETGSAMDTSAEKPLDVAEMVQSMVTALKLPIGGTVSGKDACDAIAARVEKVLSSTGSSYLQSPLMSQALTQEQWDRLALVNDAFGEEYSLRRQMLLQRLDVTIQSFTWSERAKEHSAEIQRLYRAKRKMLRTVGDVQPQDIIVAGTDLTQIIKTSNAAVRQNTQSAIHQVLIGRVPDRGGRPTEQRAPKEMPSWKKRTEGGSQPQRSGGGRGRGKNKGKGGRVQGGWGGRGGKSGGGGGRGGGSGRGGRSVSNAKGNTGW